MTKLEGRRAVWRFTEAWVIQLGALPFSQQLYHHLSQNQLVIELGGDKLKVRVQTCAHGLD